MGLNFRRSKTRRELRDRDHNAAINIWAKALKVLGKELPSTVGRTKTNAYGETSLYLIAGN
jgi:transposase